MITRDQSINVLRRLIKSDLLGDELCEKLHEIITCLSWEEDGMSFWGGDDAEIKEYQATIPKSIFTEEEFEDYYARRQVLKNKYKLR